MRWLSYQTSRDPSKSLSLAGTKPTSAICYKTARRRSASKKLRRLQKISPSICNIAWQKYEGIDISVKTGHPQRSCRSYIAVLELSLYGHQSLAILSKMVLVLLHGLLSC